MSKSEYNISQNYDSLKKTFKETDVKKNLEKAELISKKKYVKRVFIFVSFDLVNSTSYKQQDRNDWPSVFSEFFGIIESELKKRIDNINVWKYVGDEILFYKEIKSMEEILEAPSKVFSAMDVSRGKLYDIKNFSRNKLYIKSTLWISPIRNILDEDNKKTIVDVIPCLDESIIDFIGPDIDEGFRISKYSSQNKLVLDAKITYFMLENKSKINELCDYNVEDRIKIVGYRHLKGIWNNRLYPIIWYHKDWLNPENMFLYDEHINSDISNEFKNNNYKTESIKKIQKIMDELCLIDTKIKVIKSIIDTSQKTKKFNSPIVKNLVELHCVAICIDPSTQKALIVKRSNNKNIYSGLWEFGCAKSKKNISIEDSLKSEYNVDFNIKINILKDHERLDDSQPIPLAVYNIPKDDTLNKGIIFVAKIEDDPIKISLSPKHQDYRFIGKDEISNFNEPTINDFKNSLLKAFNLYNKYTDNSS